MANKLARQGAKIFRGKGGKWRQGSGGSHGRESCAGFQVDECYCNSQWAFIVNQSNTAAIAPAGHDMALFQRQDVASIKIVDVGDSNALSLAAGDGNSTISSVNTLRFYTGGNMLCHPYSGMTGTLALCIGADQTAMFCKDVTACCNLTVGGNLTIQGTTTTLNTTNLLVEDPLVVLSKNQSGTPTLDSGMLVERGSSNNVAFIWDESADEFAVTCTSDAGAGAGNINMGGYQNFRGAKLCGTCCVDAAVVKIPGTQTIELASTTHSLKVKNLGATGSSGLVLQGSGGAHHLQLYGTGSQYGFLDGAWAGWDIRKTVNANLDVWVGSGGFICACEGGVKAATQICAPSLCATTMICANAGGYSLRTAGCIYAAGQVRGEASVYSNTVVYAPTLCATSCFYLAGNSTFWPGSTTNRSLHICKWTTGWNGGTGEALWGLEWAYVPSSSRRAQLFYDHNAAEEFVMQSNYGDIVFNACQNGNLNPNAATERLRIGAVTGSVTASGKLYACTCIQSPIVCATSCLRVGSTTIKENGSVGYMKICGSGDNHIIVGPANDNGWGYLETCNNANGLYFGTNQGNFAFDNGHLRSYNDGEVDIGNSGGRFRCSWVANVARADTCVQSPYLCATTAVFAQVVCAIAGGYSLRTAGCIYAAGQVRGEASVYSNNHVCGPYICGSSYVRTGGCFIGPSDGRMADFGTYFHLGTTPSHRAGVIGFNLTAAASGNYICVPVTHSGTGYAGILFTGYTHGIEFFACGGAVTAGTNIATTGSSHATLRMKICGDGTVRANVLNNCGGFRSGNLTLGFGASYNTLCNVVSGNQLHLRTTGNANIQINDSGSGKTYICNCVQSPILCATNCVCAPDFIAGNWFRNAGANSGMYHQSNGNYFYSGDTTEWNITGAANCSTAILRFRPQGHEATIRGSVYANSSNQIGFTDANGQWGYQMTTNGSHCWYTNSTAIRMHLNTGACLNVCGKVLSPVVFGSSCVASPKGCFSTCVQSPYVCASTAVCGQVVCALTSGYSLRTAGCVYAAGQVRGEQSIYSNNYVCGPYLCGSSWVCTAGCMCAATCIKAGTCVWGATVCSNENYISGWFRNNSSSAGLYNSATAQHFYSDGSAHWNIGGGNGSQGLRFRATHASTIRGVVYATAANEFGFLDGDENWQYFALKDICHEWRINNSTYLRLFTNCLCSNNIICANTCLRSPAVYGESWVCTGGNIYANTCVKSPVVCASSASGLRSGTLDMRMMGRLNYASSQCWTCANQSTQSDTGTGGVFNVNGDGNVVEPDFDPFGRRSLIWKTCCNDTGNNADGGWNKVISNVDPNKSYMSVVYVKRNSSSTNGTFYFGAAGNNTLTPAGATNTNPYFVGMGIGSLEENVWYVAIGTINANNDSCNGAGYLGGLWRICDGVRQQGFTPFKMCTGTGQCHRTYLYYSTDPAAELWWWGPGFYEVNGNEPTIAELTGGTARLYDTDINSYSQKQAKVCYGHVRATDKLCAANAWFTGTTCIHADDDSRLTFKNVGTNAIAMYADSGDEIYIGSNNAASGAVRFPAAGGLDAASGVVKGPVVCATTAVCAAVLCSTGEIRSAAHICSVSNNNTTTVPTRFYASQDGYLRYYDRNYMKMYLGGTYKYNCSRKERTSDTNYWVGSMGWGSCNLNTLFHCGSGFWDSWSNPSNQPSGTSHWNGINVLHYANGSTGHGFQMTVGAGNPALMYVRGIWGTSFSGWCKIWNQANDGAGSGLDADLLDGQQGSYYYAASNPSGYTTCTSNLVVGAGSGDAHRGDHGVTAYNHSQASHAPSNANYITNNNQLTNGAGYTTCTGTSCLILGTTSTKALRGDYAQTAYTHSQAAHAPSNATACTGNVRSDAGWSWVCRQNFNASATANFDTIATASGSQGGIEIYNNGAGNDAFMAFHAGGDYALYFGLDADNNKLSVGGWSMGANKYEIYHSGNKPSLATLGYTGATNANYITNNSQLSNSCGYTTCTGNVVNTQACINTQCLGGGSLRALAFCSGGSVSHPADTDYSIFRASGAWSNPYPDLVINFHTGIRFGAYYGYQGFRFFCNSTEATAACGDGSAGLLFSVGKGDAHVRVHCGNFYSCNLICSPTICATGASGYTLRTAGCIYSNSNIVAAAGIYASGVMTWSGGGSANANTAYTHSQASHAPSNANYITNNNQLSNGAGYTTCTGNVVNGQSSIQANEFYAVNWFRNCHSGEGMYNQTTGQHFYSDHDDFWNIAGGTTANGLRFRDEHAGTVRGYVYADNSNSVGFLDAGASWAYKIVNDSSHYWYSNNAVLRMHLNTSNCLCVCGGVRAPYICGTTGVYGTHSGSGASLTSLNAANISSGTVATARMGSGTANSSTFLRGDNTWATPAAGGSLCGFTQSASPRATAVGYLALTNNTGSGNTAFGTCALKTNTSGFQNTASGYRALCSNTSGNTNTAIGMGSMQKNTTGFRNVAVGSWSLHANLTASGNVVVGDGTMQANTTGAQNSALGTRVLYSLTSGSENTASGYNAGYAITTGQQNVAIGAQSLRTNTTGSHSTAVGWGALRNTTTGYNVGYGSYAMYSNTTGGTNTSMGYKNLYCLVSGNYNTAVGARAGYRVSTGCQVTAVGNCAGCGNTSGKNNIYIGHIAGSSNTTASNRTYIGNALTANTYICGSLSKSSGCFNIPHPDPAKREKYDLVHSFVESPTEGDNIYRWSTDTTSCRSVIELPDYYRYLNKNDQVWVSPNRHFGNAYGEVTEDQKCLVICSQTDGSYNVLLIGTRKDAAVSSWSGPEVLAEKKYTD